MRALGTVVWVMGILLIIGNLTGAFPTFPFCGFIVTAIGVAMMKSDATGSASPAAARVDPTALNSAIALLEDARYRTAIQMVMENAETRSADPGAALVRGTAYLEEQGVPAAEAERNLRIIAAALHAAKGDLGREQPGDRVPAHPGIGRERTARRAEQNPIRAALVVALAIAVVIVVAIYSWNHPTKRESFTVKMPSSFQTQNNVSEMVARQSASFYQSALEEQKKGDAKRERGEDPREEYKVALLDYAMAGSSDSRDAGRAYNEACLHQSLADEEQAHGGDPSGNYQEALLGYDRALSINPKLAEAATNRALVYDSLGDAKRARGEDPSGEYEKALAGFDRALAANPNLWQAHNGRGFLMMTLKRHAEAISSFQAALASDGDGNSGLKEKWLTLIRLEKQLQVLEAKLHALEAARSALVPAWVAQVSRASEAIRRGDYPTARRLDEEILTGASAEAEEDPALRTTLGTCHYHLACIDSLASAGRDGPQAEAKPVEEDEAGRLRERAFVHLARAIDLGGCDAMLLSADTDLAPLRDDAHWSDVVKRLPR